MYVDRGASPTSRDDDVASMHPACSHAGPHSRARLLTGIVAFFAGLAAPRAVFAALQGADSSASTLCPGALSFAAAPPGCAPDLRDVVLGPVGLVALVVAAAVAVAAFAWLRWVNAEIEAFRRSPMLLTSRGKAVPVPIAGAEPDASRLSAHAPPAPPAPPRQVSLFPQPSPTAAPRPVARAAIQQEDARVLAFPVAVSAAPSHVIPTAGPAGSESDDATLQFVPGRLVVEHGQVGTRRELRFVRQPGPVTEITLGRQEGNPGRHVRLNAPTVSRLHARLRIEGGRWNIANLSVTNPVRLNGVPLDRDAPGRSLADGDRLGIGELELVFRER